MFSNLQQVREYVASNQVIQFTRYVGQTQWTLSIDTVRKRRFVQAALANQILADPIAHGIPVVNGTWPS
jgi:hypothetical protein